MNAVWKKRWCKALRSGKYPQAQGCLRTDDGFCCLGVGCDIVDPTKWSNWSTPGARPAGWRYDNTMTSHMPKAIRQFTYGLSETEESALVDLNDKGADFFKIADYIEANF